MDLSDLVRRTLCILAAAGAFAPLAHAAEHVTLKNGFELDCVRREVDGERVRLYFAGTTENSANYLEVDSASIQRIETVPDAPVSSAAPTAIKSTIDSSEAPPTAAEMHEMLARAGEQHHIDADMLASVVKAESGGQVHAVSRTGARGLMQLMPGTAAQLGVADSFRADQNIAGGTAYLDQLLTRYHDNVALALAAYNAGPGAVDRWHGVPPYRETRAYVARVIREFNRRKQMTMMASAK
ncbi:lytic transglycosylase domain-containing protein [Granulicella arctica]|uniref:Soluble lytic murein transglycosylase-like protein n=1 Tax=Granulicella arctica TaxID=940613 RepID=A0A7Y9PHW9_9BACT|nr:lytic transglycosylase domain-containing protein [Granulicella arctica]NYF79461.1 soluble lytic murein transglycosylase-like protein [Granulicella arctica]